MYVPVEISLIELRSWPSEYEFKTLASCQNSALKKLRVKFYQENVAWGATQTGLILPRSWLIVYVKPMADIPGKISV